MGVSYRSVVVAGVRFRDLKPVTRKEDVTVVRYDTITGKPYDVVIEKWYTKIGNIEIEGNLRDVLKRFCEDFESEEEMKNEFGDSLPSCWSGSYVSDIRYDNDLLDQIVIGYRASKGHASSWDVNQMIHEFEHDDVLMAMTSIENWLVEIGANERIVPSLFVVQSASY